MVRFYEKNINIQTLISFSEVNKISLEKITLDFKGVKIHLKPVRHGVIIFDTPDHSIESPNQYVEVEFDTPAGSAKTSMRYHADIGEFPEYICNVLARVRLPAPDSTDEEEIKIRKEIGELYSFLVEKGYTTFNVLRTDYLFQKEN